MINITDNKNYLEIKGHAHQGEGLPTKEEVEACAGVTALVHALIASMATITHTEPEFEFRRGYFKVMKSGLTREDLLFIDMFMAGVDMLTSVYGDYINEMTDQA